MQSRIADVSPERAKTRRRGIGRKHESLPFDLALLDLIFGAAGHPTKIRAMPGWLATGLGWFIPLMRELAEMQYQWQHDYDFRCDRYLAAFGYEVAPHAEAARRTVEWFKAHPKAKG
ncbi:hypothetical protein [Nannocystis pusilla]|uniref:hypothetical protein n=1 Tax=Nannocystis pusilla TaxID=889268 RepID=UPI003DA36B3A